MALLSLGLFSLTLNNVEKVEKIPISVYPIVGLLIMYGIYINGKKSPDTCAEKK